jgi:hypothetical protein
MHMLHFILIQSDRDLEAGEVLVLAADAIEPFRDEVFDWHAEGPGRWGQEYPAPVSFRKDPERFRSELETLVQGIKRNRRDALDHLVRQLGLKADSPAEYMGRALFDNVAALPEHTLWAAIRFLKLMRGDYVPDCGFYDAVEGSARMPNPEQILQRNLGETEDLYLVPMDLHC